MAIPGMSRFRLLIPLAALIACFVVASPAEARDPGPKLRRSMFGLTGWSFPTRHDISPLTRRGLRSWRTTLSWADVERTRGRYEWSGFDNLLATLASRRVSVFFVINGCPEWACHRNGFGPPRTPGALAAWARFGAAAAHRYGANGEFWRAHPGLRYLPVLHWQVMNEINGSDQWPDPDPAAYARLLKVTATAIRAADPHAQIVIGGLGEKMTIWLRDYLAGLYRQPGFARDFDVMAPEGYAPRPRDVGRIMRTTLTIMRRNNDSAKPVWITEMSWATGGPRHAFATSKRGQAKKLRRSYDLLLACRKRWNLQRVYWFGFRDKRKPPGQLDYWGYHNGLMTLRGRWKPAMKVFLQYLRGRLPHGHHTSCRAAASAARRAR
jgi:hypothetical protein